MPETIDSLARYALPVTPADAPFAVSGPAASPSMQALLEGLCAQFVAAGHPSTSPQDPRARIVLHPVDRQAPKPFRRKLPGTFVAALAEAAVPSTQVLQAGYPYLLRALANVCVLLNTTSAGPESYFITIERAAYPVAAGMKGPELWAALYRRLAPLALSRLVIGNQFRHDLPPELARGNDATAALSQGGERLAALDLLVAPFPLSDLLTEADLRHVQKLYGLGGLSYGNLSVRQDATSFWMSASGVDKRALRTVGEDMALVVGLAPDADALVIRVPATVRRPRHISVDAIEHYMIYREHPQVGAIVHVHAWLPDAPVTTVNYPCGTFELAAEVAGLLRRAPDPARAVIGLKNHGVTVTGPTMADILDRIEGRLLRQVPPLD